MKNYNEMARDVLRRMDEYETVKKKRNARFAKTAASLCCFTLVLLLGTGVRHSGLMEPEIPATIDDALYPGIPDMIDDRTEPTLMEPAVVQPTGRYDVITVNGMDSAPGNDRMNIALMWDDFIGMDKAELNTYYGTNVFPTVPEELTAWGDESYGIFCRDGGSGELYWGQNTLNFSDEDLTRWVCVTVNKGSLPFSCVALTNPAMEKSVINDTEAMIGQWDTDCYYAEFMYRDVGFRIITEGLTLDELVEVIASLAV